MELGSARARKKARWRRMTTSIYTTTTLLMVILMLNIFWCSTGFFFSVPKCNVLGSIGQSRLQEIVCEVQRRNSRTLSLDVPPFSKQGGGEEFQSKPLSEDEGKRKCDDDVTESILPPHVLGLPDERYDEFLLAIFTNVVFALCVNEPLTINSAQETAQQHFGLCIDKRRSC